MEQPVICVIVPVYKAEATLPRCIESVLTQQLPGGLRLILVDDQSPDRSGEICDAYAAKDPRVMVLRRRERGVSGARNAGLRAATGEYIVFLDSDDALRPGALAAALAAQAAAPNAFVLWHYTMQPDDTTPVTTVAHPAQQSDLARLHLDCLIAMPWNKLYRRTYARQLAFDQAYTLGEDLQFVLDYLALLGRCQPDFSYFVLESALTFYDCSRTGTLSTKYHANYCEVWPKHFAKLNAACTVAACPPQDMLPLHRAELQVLAEGAADILRRDPDAMPARRAKARTALQSPWLKSLLDTMRHEHCYSPYYLPCRWNSLRLLWMLSEAARTQSPPVRQAGLGGVLFAAGPHEARLNRSLLYLWYYSTFPPGSAAGLPGVLFLHRQVFGVVDCIHLLNMV